MAEANENLDPQAVGADVDRAILKIFAAIPQTFTQADWDKSPKGQGTPVGGFGTKLGRIRDELHKTPAYGHLIITDAEVSDWHTERWAVISDNIRNKILDV